MNFPWLLSTPFMTLVEDRPQVIHVWDVAEPLRVEIDNIFLCPKYTISYFREISAWPNKDLHIDARRCQRARQVEIDNAKRLACVAKVTAFTTEFLDKLGFDAFLMHGSLLGWFRHNGGQIPWDLDGDTAVTRSQCEEVVSKKYEGKAICDVLKENLPNDFSLYAIDIDEKVHDNCEGIQSVACDVPELRIGSTVDGQWCHADIFFLSTDDDNNRLCVPREACIGKDDIFPLRNASILESYPVKIPAHAEEVLSALYNGHFGIMNMQDVPQNYVFEDYWAVVVGDELDHSFQDRVTIDRPRLYESVTTMSAALVLCGGLIYFLVHNRRRRLNGFAKVR